ncbi:MAG TPA: SMC-Scp complex subunit ScpB [Candidatus Acidoferrales bacterium]|nr:SMC-Scp complex subunit ScpB [Candidatus Acidoferrales bacterium]
MTEERESQEVQSQEVHAKEVSAQQAEEAQLENAPLVDEHARDLRLQQLQAALEGIIYVADEPASIDQLSRALEAPKPEIRAALDLLVASYATDGRGIEVRKVAGGWKFYTKPQHHEVVRRFIKSLQPPIRLTMPALETLAVIAYKQPVTAPEINEIRGVNVGGVIKTLLEKHLITTAGRKEVIGRPILYRTSKQFLMRFGLSDLDELPSLKEFEQLAQAALGSDAGVAPAEPESEAPAGSQAQNEPERSASEVSGDAREQAIEGASDNASGEESARTESAASLDRSAAETSAEPAESPDSSARAAKAGSNDHQSS